MPSFPSTASCSQLTIMSVINQQRNQNPTKFAYLRSFRLLPGQIVALAAGLLIFVGTFFLMLPFSTPSNVELRFIDALFTATSAVCVTGLIVMDTPTEFTLFGQLVILLLIQIVDPLL